MSAAVQPPQPHATPQHLAVPSINPSPPVTTTRTMSNPHQFPNVRDKLSAPSKKSAFEKARLEAEEKRKREEAETAAVYKDFVASFDEGPPDGSASSSFRGGYGRGGAGFRGVGGSGAPGRRHFSGGRGGLGGVPPPSLRKRNLGEAFERDEEEGGIFGAAAAASSPSAALTDREKRRLKDGSSGLLAFENSGPAKRRERYAADEDSDSEVALHPKPTLLLSSLPPNITKSTITDLLAPTSLKIDSIRIIPAPPPPGPSQPSPSVRKAASALVTLSQDTPVSDIEAAVSSLNGQYIGYGFWLGIVRHLSSAVAGSAATGIPIAGAQAHPFGAKAPRSAPSVRGGPHRGRFAPPTSFGAPGRAQQQQSQSGQLQVHVHPPQDLKVLRLIHGTIEALLTHGTEFEALLMSKDEVRTDPKFAWLWDARSPAGVYYRWKLWEIVTGFSIDKPYTPTVDIFDSSSAVWVPPKKPLKYEWAGSLNDVVEDYDFMSDELDEDDSDDDDCHNDDRPVGLAGGEGKRSRGYLGVLERAKLIHLISRVPTTTSKVRRGDVGRVMAFTMEHAEGGMGEEVVDILVSNVLRPLAFTKAAKRDSGSEDSGAEKDGQPDTSSAKIVGLWIISDVLSNSSLGVRAAWRYRQLFDVALRERKVFSHLGEIYRESGWGRMKAEKFRRMVVEGVLEGWEKWCIFPQATYDAFLEAFLSGPEKKGSGSSKEQKSRSHSPTAAAAAPQTAAATKSRWKTVEATPSVFNPKAQPLPVADDDDVDGVPMIDDDVDGEPMVEEDDDVDGEPMVEDSDTYEPPEEIAVDEPMEEEAKREEAKREEMQEEAKKEEKREERKEEAEKGEAKREEKKEEEKPPAPTLGFGGMAGFKMGETVASAGPKRKRPKAEDMFADDYD